MGCRPMPKPFDSHCRSQLFDKQMRYAPASRGLRGARPAPGSIPVEALWERRHCRVPVEKAAATVAGEQLALAKLVPHLRAHTHAASGALLVLGAGDPVPRPLTMRSKRASQSASIALRTASRSLSRAANLAARPFGARQRGREPTPPRRRAAPPGHGTGIARLRAPRCVPGSRIRRFPGGRLLRSRTESRAPWLRPARASSPSRAGRGNGRLLAMESMSRSSRVRSESSRPSAAERSADWR